MDDQDHFQAAEIDKLQPPPFPLFFRKKIDFRLVEADFDGCGWPVNGPSHVTGGRADRFLLVSSREFTRCWSSIAADLLRGPKRERKGKISERRS
jgi:hypothetical protein